MRSLEEFAAMDMARQIYDAAGGNISKKNAIQTAIKFQDKILLSLAKTKPTVAFFDVFSTNWHRWHREYSMQEAIKTALEVMQNKYS